ncbi:RteC domain-containing protein [Gaetbulibacter sp. M240]|uniref:RteC domain-containing protein n=1 Tax=Gaetbulibacter sp. M240 TaxID=3126511 RepID=UPI00374FA893
MPLDQCNEILIALKEKLKSIDESDSENLKKIHSSYKVSLQALLQIKTIFKNSKWPDINDEINFFKTVKPMVLSKVVIFAKLHNIEIRKPNAADKVVKKYYCRIMGKLQEYIDSNIEFYNYYRTSSSRYDMHYFTRSEIDLMLNPDAAYFCTDTEFSTSHDTILATLMAFDDIILYLRRKVRGIERHNFRSKNPGVPHFEWTAHKSDLVELIYALQASNAVNNGNATLKDLMLLFNEAFDVKIEDYSRVFYDLQARNHKTKFLDYLKESLEIKIDKNLEH